MSRLLVVVDMQKDFVDGALGSPEAQAIVPHVLDKIKAYQDAGDEVVFTLDTHFDDYMDTMEGRKLPVVHCVKGTPGWELIPELRGISGTRFEKHTFGSRELADYAAGGQYDLWSWWACARISALYPTPCCSRQRFLIHPYRWMGPAARG